MPLNASCVPVARVGSWWYSAGPGTVVRIGGWRPASFDVKPVARGRKFRHGHDFRLMFSRGCTHLRVAPRQEAQAQLPHSVRNSESLLSDIVLPLARPNHETLQGRLVGPKLGRPATRCKGGRKVCFRAQQAVCPNSPPTVRRSQADPSQTQQADGPTHGERVIHVQPPPRSNAPPLALQSTRDEGWSGLRRGSASCCDECGRRTADEECIVLDECWSDCDEKCITLATSAGRTCDEKCITLRRVLVGLRAECVTHATSAGGNAAARSGSRRASAVGMRRDVNYAARMTNDELPSDSGRCDRHSFYRRL